MTESNPLYFDVEQVAPPDPAGIDPITGAPYYPGTGPASPDGPLQDVGWEVRCLKASDWQTILVDNPQYLSLTFSRMLSGVGGGSITFDQDQQLFQQPLADGSPAQDLLSKENLWQLYYNGILRSEWLSETVEERPLEGDETRSIVISGPDIAQVLKWGIVLPPGFPNNTKPFWTFDKDKPLMGAYLTLLNACKQRGTLSFVVPTFTSTNDSSGALWDVSPQPLQENIFGFKPALGTNLLDMLNTITGQDPTQPSTIRTDWLMEPGFRLVVRDNIGAHREDRVVFYEAGAIERKERTRAREEVYNYVVVRDSPGDMSLAGDSISVTKYKQREVLFEQGDLVAASTTSLREKMARIYLSLNKNEKSSWTIKVRPDAPGRVVFTDYGLGDWVGVETVIEPLTAYRVLAISGTVDNDGQFDLELTLESVLQYKLIAMQRQLTQLQSIVPRGIGHIPNVDTMTDPPLNGDALRYNADTGLWGPDGFGQGGLGGSGFGVRIFIQPNDPGAEAATGDLWLQT